MSYLAPHPVARLAWLCRILSQGWHGFAASCRKAGMALPHPVTCMRVLHGGSLPQLVGAWRSLPWGEARGCRKGGMGWGEARGEYSVFAWYAIFGARPEAWPRAAMPSCPHTQGYPLAYAGLPAMSMSRSLGRVAGWPRGRPARRRQARAPAGRTLKTGFRHSIELKICMAGARAWIVLAGRGGYFQYSLGRGSSSLNLNLGENS